MEPQKPSLPRLVVGLGNPGPEYEWTRHSIGMHVVRECAKRLGLVFRSERSCEAALAKGEKNGDPLFLAVPRTYMNESGRSVLRLAKLLKVDPKDLMVIVDDVETQWGQVKVAFDGGARGHNGLRSIHSLLGTKEFFQLRIGVGHPGSGAVAEYVLRRFTAEEMGELPPIMEQAVSQIDSWLDNQQRYEPLRKPLRDEET